MKLIFYKSQITRNRSGLQTSELDTWTHFLCRIRFGTRKTWKPARKTKEKQILKIMSKFEKHFFEIFQTYSGVRLGKYSLGGEESDFQLRNLEILQESFTNFILTFINLIFPIF